MATSRPARRARPALPRLVDQLRLLLWFQFYVTLLTLVPIMIVAGLTANASASTLLTTDSVDQRIVERLSLALVVLAGVAILLAICAGTVRRGWIVLYPLILLTEVAVGGMLVLLLAEGIYSGLYLLLTVAFGVWAVIDLCRGEVRGYLLRRPRPAADLVPPSL